MVDKYLEVLHAELLFTYCKIDSRFKQLAQVLKAWKDTVMSHWGNN